VPRWAKQWVAVLLLPLCLGTSRALFWLLAYRREAPADPLWIERWPADLVWVVLLAGGACWWVIYLMLPKPMWAYVVGHELTHVLWAWLFGGRVKRFRATARGGHVVVTKINFLIILAPYFFPLYAIGVVAAHALCLFLVPGDALRIWFLLLLGAAYAFHVTLTWHALKTEQTDITSQGYLFSAVVIWLGNVAVLLLGLPLLLDVPHSLVVREIWIGTREAVAWMLPGS
jgi:hypothetical protein